MPSDSPSFKTALRQTHQVKTYLDPLTGAVFFQEWLKNGVRDRADGPATFCCDPATGTVTNEEWYKDGHLHRTDGPAKTSRNPETSTVTHEEWYKNDRLHRTDGPATIRRDNWNGVVTNEEWHRDGLLHRTDGPAKIGRNAHGTVDYEVWFLDGKRIDAIPPEVIQTQIDGLKSEFEKTRAKLTETLGHMKTRAALAGTPSPR